MVFKNGEMNYKEEQLKPCPFCGGAMTDDSYDRGHLFKCIPCGYSRSFPGLLTLEKNDNPIPYVDDSNNPVPPDKVKTQEYYHYENVQKAIDEMNKRWKQPK